MNFVYIQYTYLYVPFVTYFLYFYNFAHLPFLFSWGLACNIIFVFLCFASSRCIARVIGFSRLSLCVWSMGLCYSQVSQTYLRICFSVTSLFHQLCFHSWIFVGKIRFCVPNRQLTRDSKSPFSVFYVRTGSLFFPSIVGLVFKNCKLVKTFLCEKKK